MRFPPALLVWTAASLIAGCSADPQWGALPANRATSLPSGSSANSRQPGSSSFAVLHRFNGHDGGSPVGPLVTDANGNLYGITTYGGAHNVGTIFELARPQQKGGTWTESLLYSFARGSGGMYPQPGLVRDTAGNLYGVTYDGGKCTYYCGVAFELSPSASTDGKWRYSVLHAFDGAGIGGGGGPVGNLVMDASGNLYGATNYGGSTVCTNDAGPCGLIFELSPTTSGSGTWHETVLHAFTGIPDGDTPDTGVTLDPNGNVFGTTRYGGTGHCNSSGLRIGCGVVFELSAAGSAWNETIPYDFSPKTGSGGADAALLLRRGGTFLGPVGYNITEFIPQVGGGKWRVRQLYQFQEGIAGTFPSSALVSGGKGHYFGTTALSGLHGYGTIYRMARGASGWSVATLHTFSGGFNSLQPRGSLVFGFGGALYGTTSSLTHSNRGSVFQINP